MSTVEPVGPLLVHEMTSVEPIAHPPAGTAMSLIEDRSGGTASRPAAVEGRRIIDGGDLTTRSVPMSDFAAFGTVHRISPASPPT
ncbi:MAG: hypothetical protein R2715_22115 [Ilumatobacteraceae bacterium]